MATSGRRVALLLILSMGLACSDQTPPDPLQPNIVLISVASLRPDHLSCYGHQRATSPAIDQLAKEGVLFEVATSSSSWSLPAHAALFTGLPDFVHGVDHIVDRLMPDQRTLAEAMQTAGYRTVGIWSSPLLDPRFGLDQGFEEYWGHRGPRGDVYDQQDWSLKYARSLQDISGPGIQKKVDAALSEDDGRPLFLFVHLWDTHHEYLAPSPFGSMFTSSAYEGDVDGRNVSTYSGRTPNSMSPQDRQQVIDLYDGEVAWADHQVSRILASLDAHGLGDEAAVVITADHGVEFFEHGRFGHQRSLNEPSIRIPLVMRYPGRLASGLQIGTPVRIIDIAPTLLEWADAEPLAEILGRSVQPLLDGEPLGEDAVAVAELADGPTNDRSIFTVRTKRWKLSVQSEQALQLFDLLADPLEQNNVYGVDEALTQEAKAQLRTTVAELERLRLRHAQPLLGTGRLSADIENTLQAQGHLSEVWQAENPIWADPNPAEVCDDLEDPFATTTIHWNAPAASDHLELYVWPAGTVFATALNEGSQITPNWVRDGMEFSLVDTSTGEELGRTRISVVPVECSDP